MGSAWRRGAWVGAVVLAGLVGGTAGDRLIGAREPAGNPARADEHADVYRHRAPTAPLVQGYPRPWA